MLGQTLFHFGIRSLCSTALSNHTRRRRSTRPGLAVMGVKRAIHARVKYTEHDIINAQEEPL